MKGSGMSLITKVTISSLIGILCIGGIVGIALFSLQRMEHMFGEILDRDVTNAVKNAELGREVNQIFAEVMLLMHDFVGDERFLHTEGTRLLDQLELAHTHSMLSGNDALHTTLRHFTEQFQVILTRCAAINDEVQTFSTTHSTMETTLMSLEEAVTEKMLLVMMEGKDHEALTVKQINSMLPGYQLTLAQIALERNRVQQESFETEGRDQAAGIRQEVITALLDGFRENLRIITTSGKEFAPLGQALIESVEQYQQHIVSFYGIVDTFQKEFTALQRAQVQVITAAEESDRQIVETTSRMRGSLVQVIQSSRQMIAVLFAVVMVMLSGGIYYMVRTIRPLRQLVALADQLSRGDLSCQIVRAATHDEIGHLSRAFARLLAYMQEMADAASRISQGDLSRAVQVRSERDVLGHAFRNMTAYLNDVIHEAKAIATGDLRRDIQPKADQDALGAAFCEIKGLRESIGLIMDSAVQLSMSSEELGQISEQMASAAEETSRQTSVISANSHQIAENVEAVATAIAQIMHSLSNATQHTSKGASEVQEAARDLAALAKRLQELVKQFKI